MEITLKHKAFLWVICFLFMALVLGEPGTNPAGEFMFTLYLNGMVSSLIFLVATTMMTQGERSLFIAGIVLWVVAVVALLVVSKDTLVVFHL